jgi:type I site-specific restriction-modification system R (restriction) subunit
MNEPAIEQMILYETPTAGVQIEVRLDRETVWLNQQQMTELFGRDRSVITKHIRNIFQEGELEEKSNVQILHIPGSDKPVKFYNLDVIISVGYRVKSVQGTRFRQTEDDIEQMLLEQLQNLGYAHLADFVVSPDGTQPEREAYSDTILTQRLRAALDRLNPTIPASARDDAFKKLVATEKPNLIEENRRLHQALVTGIDVEFYAEDGTIRGDKVYAIDFDNPDRNDWLVLNQFTVIENRHNRRPDVVIFINGLPLAVIEIKNPGTETATLEAAYNQIQTYKSEIPALFRTNALLVTTDGLTARIGSLTADLERFMPWRTIDGTEIAPKGTPEIKVLAEGVLEKQRLLHLIENFIIFGDSGTGIRKIIAGYHQFYGREEVFRAPRAGDRPLPHQRS